MVRGNKIKEVGFRDCLTVVKLSAFIELCFAVILKYTFKTTHRAIEETTNGRIPLRIPRRGYERCREVELWWRAKVDAPDSLGDHMSVPMTKKMVVLVVLANPVIARNDWYVEQLLLFKISGFMKPKC